MASVRIDLKDQSLFGNDAAEDEDGDVFASYVLERPEIADFSNPGNRICVARAYKGDGKSALLRLTSAKVSQIGDNPIVVACSANSIAPALQTADFTPWLKAWKAALFGQVASEIGATIGAAWSDDAMSLVEEAERNGFKSRNIVSAILDRLKIGQIGIDTTTLGGMSKERLGTSSPEKVLQRWAKNATNVWLIIDDVDLNFQNTAIERAKVAAFFVACREIINSVNGLCVRAAVRPNIWTIIKLEFEALSHVEQYTYDLAWSEDAIRSLLAKRVEAYLRRGGMFAALSRELPTPTIERDKALIGLVFEGSMEWGHKNRPPHVLIYTLSKHRPRWAVELCKVAAKSAASSNHNKITRADIFDNLAAFGKRRREDTVAEFRSQCPEVDELVGAFARESEQFQTSELLKLIENKILNHLSPHIVGIPGKPHSRDVAAFLFEIGIFYGRRQLEGDTYEHVGFSDQPGLWRSRTDMDRGLSWEIHPVFRQTLEIRDASGREYAPKDKRRGRRD